MTMSAVLTAPLEKVIEGAWTLHDATLARRLILTGFPTPFIVVAARFSDSCKSTLWLSLQGWYTMRQGQRLFENEALTYP